MKKYAAFAASVAIGAVALVGCGGEDDFCSEAEDITANASAGDTDVIQDLADKAPDEIKADFETLADTEALADDPAAAQEAWENIEAWGKDNCDS